MKKGSQHEDILRQSRKIKKRRVLNKWFLSGLIFLCLLLAFIIVSNLETFQISRVKVSGTEVVSVSELSQLIQNNLLGRRLLIFPNRNAWIFPEMKIREGINREFINVDKLSFSTSNDFDHPTLSVQVQEKVPVVRWCRESSPTECYLSDKQGLIFALAPEFSHYIFPTIVQALPINPLGIKPLSLNKFNQLIDCLRGLQGSLPKKIFNDFVVYQITDLKAGDYSFLVENRLNPEENFRIMVNSEKDLGAAVRSTLTTLSSPVLLEELNKNNRSLEYLDLRFAPKVFYKFRPVI